MLQEGCEQAWIVRREIEYRIRTVVSGEYLRVFEASKAKGPSHDDLLRPMPL
jgi:hypothetical protein